jgi:hypothetical protein
LTLSQYIEKLHHIEINFDGKYQRKMANLGNFEMSPRCHGNRKFTPEHVITKAIATIVLKYILNKLTPEQELF